MFNSNTSKYLLPSLYLSIDETLYPMKHQIAFQQYNPSKPYKYRLLLKSINDASFPYTYNACPYAGKPVKGEGPYYIESTENYVCYLVNRTANDVELQGRNISMDRLYTRISLANWLLDRKITYVGTLNHNRQGIPTELKNKFEREEFSVTCHYPAGIYLFKVNNRNTRTRCEICSKLTIKTPERRHWAVVTFIHCKNKIFW